MIVVIVQVEQHPRAGLVFHPDQVPAHFRKELPLGSVRGLGRLGQQLAGDQDKIRSLLKRRLDQLFPLWNELVQVCGEEESGHGLIQFARADMQRHRALTGVYAEGVAHAISSTTACGPLCPMIFTGRPFSTN